MIPHTTARVIHKDGNTHFLKEADAKARLVSPREYSTQMWEANSSRYDALKSTLLWIAGKPVGGSEQKSQTQKGMKKHGDNNCIVFKQYKTSFKEEDEWHAVELGMGKRDS